MTRSAARAATLIVWMLLLRAAGDGEPSVRAAERAAPASGGGRLLYGERLDPNREPAAVLALLPGIGPMRAAAIVAGRPHCSLADLDGVPGVGPATLRTLAEGLAFDDLPHNCDPELHAIAH